MNDIRNIQKIYFIGIGGIGMSSLARYFKSHGRQVSGYDRTETQLTRQLIQEGIPVHYTDDLLLAMRDPDLVVYTPAIPKDHQELDYYRQNDFLILKRSEVLGLITESSFNICVAGTHGKTTVTTMIAHILRDSGYGCNAFLGGIAVNYDSNFWSSEKNVCVVEADEYDRSFLRLSPDIEVITAMDPDHLDIYGTAAAVEQAFIDFSGKLKTGGLLLSRYGLEKGGALKPTNHKTYSVNRDGADIRSIHIEIKEGAYEFDVHTRNWILKKVVLNMGGMHNVENVTAAIGVAHHLGIADEKIRWAVSSFKGVKRRFEYVLGPGWGGSEKDVVFIDDYAHHPEELKALISSVKNLFPGRQCLIIFQPHLFSRTRDFAEGFAESLDLADEVILLPIYPARESPMEGVTSKLILSKMKNENKQIVEKENLLRWIEENKERLCRNGLVITAGAGDIDACVLPIKNVLGK